MSGPLHAARKRLLSHIYAISIVLAHATTHATTKAVLHDRLLSILQSAADTGQSLEVLALLSAYSIDAFMAYQFGLSLGSNFLQNEDQRKWYLDLFYARRPHLFWTTKTPGFTSFMHVIGIRLYPRWVDQTTLDLEDWHMRISNAAEEMLSEGSDIPVIDFPAVFAHERASFRKQDGKKALPDGQPYPRRLEIASDMFCHNAAAHETSDICLV